MADAFELHSPGLGDPASRAAAVTPSADHAAVVAYLAENAADWQ